MATVYECDLCGTRAKHGVGKLIRQPGGGKMKTQDVCNTCLGKIRSFINKEVKEDE